MSFAVMGFSLPKISGKLSCMSAEASETDLRRLGEAVYARRHRELRLTQAEVAARKGPSTTTQTKIENGEGPAPSTRTLRNLDRALEWEDGSSWGVLYEDIKPTPITPGPRLRALPDTEPLIDALPDTPGLSSGPLRRLLDIREQLDLVIEELRAEGARK